MPVIIIYRLSNENSLFFIYRKFDLKGSTVDREASDKELDKTLPTFKDNDFIKQGIKIVIGSDAKQKLNERLSSDVEFLTKLHLMDYSMLIGIHDCHQAAIDASEGRDEANCHHDSDSEECDSGERLILTHIFYYKKNVVKCKT